MDTVGAYDAKTHLPRLLDEVAGGKSLVITKRGVPVARLVPAGEAAHKLAPEETVAALRAARRGMRLEGLSVREMIEEGRR